MKRPASDDGGANKAPRVSSGPQAPGPSRRTPSYSIETDPSEDPATIPPECLTPSEEVGPSRRSLSYSIETDPSEDPATIPPESSTPSEEDPPEGSYDTDPSEYSAGAPGEELPEVVPVAPMVEHYVRPASSVSVTDYSSPLSWPSVNQELSPGYLDSSDLDAGDDEEEYTSPYSPPDQAGDRSST
ncbi:uncharacterized protein LOC132044341, partial [Lycium ferocissimum]|uniref:uncharacterized protein LOC132044341 n=1 Tax=Lycium ferocissimum TaxID=112874 RepID=UPI0028163A5F